MVTDLRGPLDWECCQEVERLRDVIRKHYPTIAGHVMRLQEGHESRSAAEWQIIAQDFANVLFANATRPRHTDPASDH